ncbi:uncharacterized protein LOC127749111 [Frankliniella occidentalis]|uniref:Uncharacterized protein LOC127749111 n=1 Tax=Frankliniella occidentalis TaxID=133901 RepID=A0A9C6U572_FRAOC|nr:uncharacterized protein LOC127749111 [Frankliniella occidentalis]
MWCCFNFYDGVCLEYLLTGSRMPLIQSNSKRDRRVRIPSTTNLESSAVTPFVRGKSSYGFEVVTYLRMSWLFNSHISRPSSVLSSSTRAAHCFEVFPMRLGVAAVRTRANWTVCDSYSTGKVENYLNKIALSILKRDFTALQYMQNYSRTTKLLFLTYI